QQRPDDQPQRCEGEEGDGRADGGGDHGQHHEGGAHPLEGGLPFPGEAGRQHDGERLDRFDHARDEDGEDKRECVQRTSIGSDNNRWVTDNEEKTGQGAGWLLLIYRVPPEPTRLRAAVWRRIKSLGAIYLQNSVAALP